MFALESIEHICCHDSFPAGTVTARTGACPHRHALQVSCACPEGTLSSLSTQLANAAHDLKCSSMQKPADEGTHGCGGLCSARTLSVAAGSSIFNAAATAIENVRVKSGYSYFCRQRLEVSVQLRTILPVCTGRGHTCMCVMTAQIVVCSVVHRQRWS